MFPSPSPKLGQFSVGKPCCLVSRPDSPGGKIDNTPYPPPSTSNSSRSSHGSGPFFPVDNLAGDANHGPIGDDIPKLPVKPDDSQSGGTSREIFSMERLRLGGDVANRKYNGTRWVLIGLKDNSSYQIECSSHAIFSLP